MGKQHSRQKVKQLQISDTEVCWQEGAGTLVCLEQGEHRGRLCSSELQIDVQVIFKETDEGGERKKVKHECSFK